MRLFVFGNVFAWDLLTLRCKRFTPEEKGTRAFTARRIRYILSGRAEIGRENGSLTEVQ